MEFHEPVMLEEVLEYLAPQAGHACVDATLGNGGHAREIARRIGPCGVLIGIDRDPAMLKIGRERLTKEAGPQSPAMHFFAMSFERIGEALEQAGVGRKANCILLDLGVNSLQLEMRERGFAFSKDAPMDARFNPEEGLATMAQLVNTASAEELTRWLRDYGDERLAHQIARRIVQRRAEKPLVTTTELADLVKSVYPAGKHRIHAATRTFQALRIVVNDELGAVERGTRACMEALADSGRLAILTFHSGEDKIVKRLFKEATEPRPDPSNPYSATTSEGIQFVNVTRGAVKCSEAEAAVNVRSRSAKLRVIGRKAVAA